MRWRGEEAGGKLTARGPRIAGEAVHAWVSLPHEAKPEAAKGQGGKRGGRGRKVSVLTRGDLAGTPERASDAERWRSTRQESAEAIVPGHREGPNVEQRERHAAFEGFVDADFPARGPVHGE